jgi:hypothetical protein
VGLRRGEKWVREDEQRVCLGVCPCVGVFVFCVQKDPTWRESMHRVVGCLGDFFQFNLTSIETEAQKVK